MRSLREQIERVSKLFRQHKLSFALAGGMAASVYREEERLTKDVDFLISHSSNPLKVGRQLLVEMGLTVNVARQADLDGGPLFAIKKRNTPEVLLIGRDPNKADPGVDLLLPELKWAPRALERAQLNLIDWGFALIPTITVEDVILAKLISSHHAKREQDVLDLRSIFSARHKIDFVYLISRMKELQVTVAKAAANDVPANLLRASKRISREMRRHS